ncbi:hypothetical protein DYB37_005091 [Aphanomyces astaci]|uniref:Myb-like domain-containing protein n=1 Tax=Aphanomyces astaci TaxID=112090 RepID=A0A3R7BP74_APHAT|nr:hypothetical protein DYB35_007085 [Aphanomyces astaci]RHZ19859.1 hypothetical protein DYB37_005091 [Aphanomyces astaci]
MSRWTSEDDLALLIQANNERPFLQDRVMKSWGVLACNLLKAPGFSRQECEVDGKKTSHRFHLLLDNHEKFQKESVYLSGVDQEHNEMHILLDELVALRKDNMAKKKGKQQANAADQQEKARSEAAARHIRDEAMRTCPKKRAKVQDDERDEASTTPSKKKMLVDFHQDEIQLERERLAFKKAKMEQEIEEKRLDREERREARENDRKQREETRNQMSEILALVRAAVNNRNGN